MASERQCEANRVNATKSCGPRTDAGKERSRINALKHGLRAEMIGVLPGEDPEAFAMRMDAWLEDFRPSNEYQAYLIRHAAMATWKAGRVDRYEVTALSRRRSKAVKACGGSPRQVAEAASLASFDTSNDGERLRRYQFSLHREIRRDMDSFDKARLIEHKLAQEEHNGPAIAPNEPNPDEDEIKAQAPNEPNPDASIATIEASKSPNEPNPAEVVTTIAAPNEANCEVFAQAAEGGTGIAGYLEPVPISAPNEPISEQAPRVEQSKTPNEAISDGEPAEIAPDLRQNRRMDPKRLLEMRVAQLKARPSLLSSDGQAPR